jgi:hypothetical protein
MTKKTQINSASPQKRVLANGEFFLYWNLLYTSPHGNETLFSGDRHRHHIASMWRIAKAIMTTLLDSITNLVGKRRKREISFFAMSKLHL